MTENYHRRHLPPRLAFWITLWLGLGPGADVWGRGRCLTFLQTRRTQSTHWRLSVLAATDFELRLIGSIIDIQAISCISYVYSQTSTDIASRRLNLSSVHEKANFPIFQSRSCISNCRAFSVDYAMPRPRKRRSNDAVKRHN